VTPDLAAGYIGLASTLYDFETYRDANATAGGLISGPTPSYEHTARVAAAADAWQRVLRLLKNDRTPADEAAAYYGLCRQAADSEAFKAKHDAHAAYLAYYLLRDPNDSTNRCPAGLRSSYTIKEPSCSTKHLG